MSHTPHLTRVDRAARAARVAARYAEGVSARQVADEFGLSRPWVSQLAKLYGVSRRPGKPRRHGCAG